MIVVEAWGNRPHGQRQYDPPHLVRYRPDTEKSEPRALCGAELAPLKLEYYGTADRARVRLCRPCLQWLDGHARPLAPSLAGRRRR